MARASQAEAMTFQNYKSFWDNKATTMQGAMIAVDGSTDENTVRLTGIYSADQATKALELAATDRVLELGCGVGRIGHELAPHVGYWHGVDISANMIAQARERLKKFDNVGLSELTRTSLSEFPDASFDKAYCIAVFIHMDKEDFFLYLRELNRVLKPGGRIFFDHWNLASTVGWRRWFLEVQQYVDVDPSVRKDVARNQFTTPQEVSVFLQHAGFEELGNWSESPWVQALGAKPGAGLDIAAARARAAANGRDIEYTPLWSELFNQLVDVTVGEMKPQAMLEVLRDDNRGKEIPMFRAMFLGIWRLNEKHWGAAPTA